MAVNLGNFKCEIIDFLTLPDGRTCDFTLQAYLDVYKLQRPRLYLMTKPENNNCHQTESDASDCSIDDEKLPVAFSATSREEQSSMTNVISVPDPDEVSEGSMDKDSQLENLRQARLNRVQTEPDVTEEYVLISVRHIHLGVKTRAFRLDDKMMAVYDWIGSLSTVPEYFHLYLQFPFKLLCPSEDLSVAQKQLLNMKEVTGPLPLDAKDSEISVKGFGTAVDVKHGSRDFQQ